MNAVSALSAVVESSSTRHDWTKDEVLDLFALPFMDLLHRAQTVHRAHFDPNRVQRSTLLSIKTGGCAEDCGYCAQSAHHREAKAKLQVSALMQVEDVRAAALAAKERGASRLCMGAAWRELKDRDVPRIEAMIRVVRDLGMETCMTLGMLTGEQAETLKKAGLDYYNHNIDTSPDYYPAIVHTRTFEDRIKTLAAVVDAGISVCSGGIVGLGETREDRAGMILTLATLPVHPHSVPINLLTPIEGTPVGDKTDRAPVDEIEFIRTIAVARITMPESNVRLSAGRASLSDGAQALAFLAGANSIFYGEALLTTANAETERDDALFAKLGIKGV